MMSGGKGKEEQPIIHGGAPASSRWTPTKEQINILETLYKQGIRTPTADQIQHITNRLKNYGNIEGKNVFYWFQNHKARQRQKQKQEVAAASAYFNNFYHHPSPPPPPPHLLFSPPNGCHVVAIQPTLEFGFHGMNIMQPPNVFLPGLVKRKSIDREPIMIDNKGGDNLRGFDFATYGDDDDDHGHVELRLNHHNSVGYMNGSASNSYGKLNNCDDRGTLCLFPLEPSGGGKVAAAAAAAAAVGEESWSGITVADDDEDEEMKGRRRFIDFLSRNGEMNL